MSTKLYWVDGPWLGKLAIASRPRGGDWLDDELSAWKSSGATSVVSLLTSEEERDLDLLGEASRARGLELEFVSLPIEDRGVPRSEARFQSVLENLDETLSKGKNVVAHCRQGIGRAGLLAACLLINKGWEPERALQLLSKIRGVPIPETQEQRQWIEHYASALHAEFKPMP
jgi:protein-tyrosine phosphatase